MMFMMHKLKEHEESIVVKITLNPFLAMNNAPNMDWFQLLLFPDFLK